jgi:glycolate oxidase FAD binding subunit
MLLSAKESADEGKLTPMLIQPRTEAEVTAAVLDARAMKAPLSIEGGGSKRGLGRPSQTERTLSLKGLSGITLYEPSEMVIGAWAGTPLAEVQKTLDDRGQMLAFEPIDYRILLGSAGEPTIGGLAACGIAGPRRIMAGGARDSLIGVRFVNGRGEIIKNGGRVMKNVTGLDLVKLQAGAYGTLGVLTEVIFKVVPKPEMVATLILEYLDDERAIEAMATALGSPYEITGAAHWPEKAGENPAITYLRIEGFAEQIAYRTGRLRELLQPFGALKEGAEAWRERVWTLLGGGGPFRGTGFACIWRASVPPGQGAAFARSTGLPAFYDWGGGLVWLGAETADAALSAQVQSAAARHGGYATLVKAPDEFRARVNVFQPLDPAIQTLQAGLKASFDPDGILNPGRMYAGL